jgi:hypothetical protein
LKGHVVLFLLYFLVKDLLADYFLFLLDQLHHQLLRHHLHLNLQNSWCSCTIISKYPPPPPPVDVIVENIEGDPLDPLVPELGPAVLNHLHLQLLLDKMFHCSILIFVPPGNEVL